MPSASDHACQLDGRYVTPEPYDPAERFRVYTVCQGETTKNLIATCATPEALGVCIVTLGREGEFLDCALGILDTAGEVGQKWILKPWRAMPREVSAAASVLARSKKPAAPPEDPSNKSR